eukprot:2826179-Rhodomonas_salina.1
MISLPHFPHTPPLPPHSPTSQGSALPASGGRVLWAGGAGGRAGFGLHSGLYHTRAQYRPYASSVPPIREL